jgi:hypothetical protein
MSQNFKDYSEKSGYYRPGKGIVSINVRISDGKCKVSKLPEEVLWGQFVIIQNFEKG